MKTLIIIAVLLFAYVKYKGGFNGNNVNPLDQINIAYENKYTKNDTYVEPIQDTEPQQQPVETAKDFLKTRKKEKSNTDATKLIDTLKEQLSQNAIRNMVDNLKNAIQNGINKLKSYGTNNK